MKKLNLGSGTFPKEGYVNVDNYAPYKPDVVWDLEKFPYPFENNTFELVEADHVLEHLEQPLHVIRELHRISKNGGIVHIRVPHFSRGFTHPEHKRGLDVSLPYYFDPVLLPAWHPNEVVMELVSMKLHWACMPHVKRLVMGKVTYAIYFGMGKFFDFFANLSPLVCSRLWCFWVGGFEEIEYIFKVKK